MLDPVGDDDFIVYVPERKFFETPFQVGRHRCSRPGRSTTPDLLA